MMLLEDGYMLCYQITESLVACIDFSKQRLVSKLRIVEWALSLKTADCSSFINNVSFL